MFPNLGFIIVITACFFCLLCSSNEEGESCGAGTNLGLCKKLSECPSGITKVRQKKTHNLERCGFAGYEEIVCCPDFKNLQPAKNNSNNEGIWEVMIIPNTPSRGSAVERKSVLACKQYVSSSTTSIGFYIIEGENASLGEFPHMAQIGFENPDFGDNKYTWECGGSLISSRFILTAAHCIVKADGIPPYVVRVGFVDQDFANNSEAQEFFVKNYTVHEKYNRRWKENDIALIELNSDVKVNINTYPACLYQTSENPSELFITGWGNTVAGGSPSKILQKARIESVDLSECSRLFQKRSAINITYLHICCLSAANSSIDTCQGDSGGPLQKLASRNSNVYSIVGITSYGQGCGGTTPGVYTRVSAYLDWIENIVWP